MIGVALTEPSQHHPTPASFPVVPLPELQKLNLFRDIPEHVLLLLKGRVRRATADPDATILELAGPNETFRHFFFLLRGQVKVIGLDEEARQRPLNFLRKGEFFVDKAVAWRGQVSTKIVAITPTEMFIVPREDLRELVHHHPSFESKLKVLADQIDFRNRIFGEDHYSQSVLQFLVQEKLTRASRVKITQLDKCIECNTCYDACEERHGFLRLERGYARFGILDFSKSCNTCFYPTCIPACPVDSIVFNPHTKEVEILDNCIGCCACEKACPFGAIRLHSVIEEDPRFHRFFQPNKKSRPKIIADKCNHCEGYKDMACISNCPTGALVEAESPELMENPRVFGAHEGTMRPLPSLTEGNSWARFLQTVYLGIGVFTVCFLLWESHSLPRWPALSFLNLAQERLWIPSNVSLTFSRGSSFCIFLGNLGFALVLLALFYPIRKGYPQFFKHLGKKPLWLDFHNFCGILGTLLILFHSGYSLYWDNPPHTISTLATFVLIGVMVTGLFGRFLYQMIPRGMAGTELKVHVIEEEDAAITQKLEALLKDAAIHREDIQRIIDSANAPIHKGLSLWNLLVTIFSSRFLLWRFRVQPPGKLKRHRRQIQIFLELLQKKIQFKRNLAFLDLSSRLFAGWQYIHKPLVYLLGLLVVLHVLYNLFYFPGWPK